MDSYGAAAFFVEAMGATREMGATNVAWQPVATLGGIAGRYVARYDGNRYSTQNDTEVLAAGARFCLIDTSAWARPLFFGFGPAYNQQATKSLSSHYEFMSTLGWQGRRFSFQLRHLSNGGLHEPNRGETMALLGVSLTN